MKAKPRVTAYPDPIFIGMETMQEGADPIHIRFDNLDGDGVDLMVEEDQEADAEIDTAWQAVSYLVIDGAGDLTGYAYGQAPTATPTPTATQTPTLTPTDSGSGDMTSHKLARPALDDPLTETPTPTATTAPSPTPTQTPQEAFESAQYIYDGNGTMVKSIIDGLETYYIGGHYEVQVNPLPGITGEITKETKYYSGATGRFAMRVKTVRNNGIFITETDEFYWIFSDHLQSSSVILEEDGSFYSRTDYTAFGEIRYQTDGVDSPTDYQYTGQRSYVEDFGLHYYVARWYDPYLNQFIQPDTLIPDPGNSGDWNRYAYVLYNPANFNDPTGHVGEGPDGIGTDDDYDEENDPLQREWIYILSPDPAKFLLSQGGGKNSCGPTALAMVINYLVGLEVFDATGVGTTMYRYGRYPADLDSISPKINDWITGDPNADPGGATFPWGMERTFNYYAGLLSSALDDGFPVMAFGSNFNSVDDVIRMLHKTGNPVSVLLNMGGGDLHWVNVVGYDADTIYTMDLLKLSQINPYDRGDFNTKMTDPIYGIYRGYMVVYYQYYGENNSKVVEREWK